MTAPRPAAVVVRRVPLELVPWRLAQDEADARAVRCRALCAELFLSDALTAALVARAASRAVVLAAANAFELVAWRRWRDDERDIAADVVAHYIDMECAGLLERPCVEPRAGGAP